MLIGRLKRILGSNPHQAVILKKLHLLVDDIHIRDKKRSLENSKERQTSWLWLRGESYLVVALKKYSQQLARPPNPLRQFIRGPSMPISSPYHPFTLSL
jgi:hypothetical protein